MGGDESIKSGREKERESVNADEGVASTGPRAAAQVGTMFSTFFARTLSKDKTQTEKPKKKKDGAPEDDWVTTSSIAGTASKAEIKRRNKALGALGAEADFSVQKKSKQDWVKFLGVQSVAFVLGISCWYHGWFFNLERGGLFMDDVMIKRNMNVVDPQFDWDRLIRTDYWGLEMFDPQVWTHKSFRPVTVYSFRFDYQTYSFDSSAFHRHNIILHGIAGLITGFCAWWILDLNYLFSGLLTYLFLAHPVHTESLLYIVGRADPQCYDFMCIAMLLYHALLEKSNTATWTRSNVYGRLITSGVLLSTAMTVVFVAGLCKETGFTTYGLFVLLEGFYLLRHSMTGDEKNMRTQYMVSGVRTAFVLVVGGLVVLWRLRYTQGESLLQVILWWISLVSL